MPFTNDKGLPNELVSNYRLAQILAGQILVTQLTGLFVCLAKKVKATCNLKQIDRVVAAR